MTVLDIFRFLSVFASGIATGPLVAVFAGLIPLLRQLPPPEALKVKVLFDPLIDRYQPLTVVLAAVSGVVIILHDLTTLETVCTAIGLLGSLGVGITSGAVNVRINHEMASWPPDTVPPEFEPLLARWIRFHGVRMLSSLVGLAGFVLAIVNP
jgi:uncharacterized membrane protein